MADDELIREDGDPSIKFKFSEEDRKRVDEAVELFTQYANDVRQLNIILTPKRKEMLSLLLAIVRDVT